MQLRTRTDVLAIIQSFVDGTCGPYDWDDFVCEGRISDPALETIRARCALLPDEFPPTQIGHYCGAAGLAVLRGYVEQLGSHDREA